MNECEINLIPAGMKNLMKTIRKIGICAEIGAVFLLVLLGIFGYFSNSTTGILTASLFHLIIAPVLIPGLLFDKVSQSTIRFAEFQMQILDKRGKCWRTIDYCEISMVCAEEISGFFYGRNQSMARNKYVCVYLNGSTTIPDVSFAKLFSVKNFIMFGYHPDVFKWLQQKCQGKT